MTKITGLKTIIGEIYQLVGSEPNMGNQADYIPELLRVDKDKFGVHISSVYDEHYGIGDFQECFSIQSIAKVLSLSLAYSKVGEDLWKRLGVEPSGTRFNSLVQLESDLGIPRNPFVNAGALVICDVLLSVLDDAQTELLDYVRLLSGETSLIYSKKVADSEKVVGFRNNALCNFIKSFGNIQNDPETVLDLYFNLCSIELSCNQLSRTFMYLANSGKTLDGTVVLTPSQTKRINALMLTCGLYDESGEFAFKVGLPGKSGVGGGIIAVHPGLYSVAVWSPLLNEKGNSTRGVRFLEHLTTFSQLSIF